MLGKLPNSPWVFTCCQIRTWAFIYLFIFMPDKYLGFYRLPTRSIHPTFCSNFYWLFEKLPISILRHCMYKLPSYEISIIPLKLLFEGGLITPKVILGGAPQFFIFLRGYNWETALTRYKISCHLDVVGNQLNPWSLLLL